MWAFASPRENCEEIVIFRRGKDLARKWDGDSLHEPKVGLDMFFLMRMRQISEDTPLSKQFNGEWGFWESFFVPLLDEESSLQTLAALDTTALEERFAMQRLPVTCHQRPDGQEVLKIPSDLVVRYEVRVSIKDLDAWSELCNKIGEDLILQFPLVVDQKPLKPGSECVRASSEMGDLLERSQLKKRLLEELKLPVELTFECDMNVSTDWQPDVLYLQSKFDHLGKAYGTDLLNGYSADARLRPSPWHPMARLAISALNKIFARYPGISSIMDVGCGDMAWMNYFLKDHPNVTYVGVDMLPFCLAFNIRRYPKMHFAQTDLSNTKGIEIMPQGCDLVLAKEVFNQMVLPDAVDALKRVVCTRPRFLLTHVTTSSDNTGWEKRIDNHRELTPYDFNKPPFSLPYPATEIQRISDDAYFVLYQITPDLPAGSGAPPPPRVEALGIPEVPGPGEDLESFITVAEGEMMEPEEWRPKPQLHPRTEDGEVVATSDELGPRPAEAGAAKGGAPQELIYELTDPKGIPLDLREAPDLEAGRTGESIFPGETFDVAEVVEAANSQCYLKLADGRGWAFTKSGRDGRLLAEPTTDHKKIKGVKPREFRSRCDLIFEKFDQDTDGVLNFEELVALMDAGGRNIEEYEAYAGLCTRLGADPRVGLTKKETYKLFEKAPQSVWEEIYRSINPLKAMVVKGAEKLPETFFERPMPNFLFADDEQTAKIYIEVNEHIYYGAADVVTADNVQAFFGKQRLEVHIVAPGSYGTQDLFKWKLVITPLTGDIVPEDCSIELKETVEKAAMQNKRIVVRLVKSKKKKWGKVGQAVTGQKS